MINKSKWLVSSLLVLSLSLSQGGAFARESQITEFLVPDKVTTVAQDYIDIIAQNAERKWRDSTLKFEFPLYDFDGQVTSYLFTVLDENGNDTGYLVVSNSPKPVVLESTREGTNPYRGKKNQHEKAIYVGPLMHLVETGSKSTKNYIDVVSGIKIEAKKLKSRGVINGDNVKNIGENTKNSDIGINSIISYSSEVLNVADMDWHMGCSPTSFGNIIRYWDKNGYSNLVQSSTSDEDLIEWLANDMNTNPDGSTNWNDRVNGMEEYWEDRGYSVDVARRSPSYTRHKNEIDDERPDIINVVDHPIYDDHDMTGVGYEQYQDTEQSLKWYRYVIVHDTWPATPKNIYLYVDDLLDSWNEIVTVEPE